ncbi:hypothetical protein [Virgibacillus kimchii]
MPRYIIHFTFIFFIITAISGVWMRAFAYYPDFPVPYTNILHGHSHLAILGWAFLGVFAIFLINYWQDLKQKKQAIAIAVTLFIVTLLMFAAFIYQGYAMFSIALSTMHIFIEYWAAVFIYRQLKSNLDIPHTAKLYIKGALIALVVSSLGPYVIAYVSASGLKESALYEMAIYFYLHFQYNGWLLLFLIGLFIIILHLKKITLSPPMLKIGFWVYFVALFPGYFLSVLWVEELGISAGVIAAVGGIGQWIGVIYIIFAYVKSHREIKSFYSKLTTISLQLSFLLLFLKSSMELGLLFPSLLPLIYDSRSVIIGYLHFTLLGFVSIFMLTQYLMQDLLKSTKLTKYGAVIFLIGFLLNEGLLFGQGLTEWLQVQGLPLFNLGVLTASIILTLGICVLWLSFCRNK